MADQKVAQLSKLPEVQHELTQVNRCYSFRSREMWNDRVFDATGARTPWNR